MARRKYNIAIIKQIVDGENPFFQSGYGPKEKRRKNGESWTDAKGRSWKKVNGAVISVNEKADIIREMIKPVCSVCGQRIDFSCDRLDKKIFPKTGKCFDCLQNEEMLYRVNGTWKEYENLKILKNKLSILRDFKQKVMESIEFLENDTGKMELVMPTGELMNWNGKSNPQLLINAKEDLVRVDDEIKKMEKEIFKSEKKE